MRLVRRKSRKPEASKLDLERVIGLTTSNANGLASNPATGDIAYIAGCVVVVYNVKTNSQIKFLTSTKSQKAFSCVAYSYSGGKFIAAGETGHQPAVVVWEASTGASVADLRTHKYGVSCLEFSPNGKYLLSVGVPHDGFLCLWDWKGGVLLIKTRSTAATLLTSSVHFSSDGSFFVTGGTKHLKHWTIGGQGQGGRARSAGGLGTIALEGRPVKLGSQMRSSFAAISCARPLKDTIGTSDTQPLYALTTAGVLCLLHCGVAVEKWVDLRVRRGYGLAVSETHIACSCSDGIVRVFLQLSLAYAATMPRPAPYGFHGLTDGNAGMVLAMGQRLQPGIKFPDAVACQFLHEGQKLAVIYGDHSLFVWDVGSFNKIGKHRAFLSHSGCVWDVKNLPTWQWESADSETTERDGSAGAIATCSADGSIRIWNMSLGEESEHLASPVPDVRPGNIYSKELLGVLYLDPTAELKDKCTGGGSEDEFLDTTQGFRSICASPDGLHLAAGDRSGNLRVFDLETMKLISFQEAHDAEILSLSFTAVMEDKIPAKNNDFEPPLLLASGGRDRLIHVYDVRRDYDVIETLDDHSASITAVKFRCNGSKLLSCSADKSVVFRNVVSSPTGCKSVRYHQEVAPRGTIYDLDVDASEKFVVTVGQDKKINVLNLASGKPVRCFKPEGDAGEAVKVQFDPSGAYVVCSHTDKCLRIYEFSTGELIAQAAGHAEVITGVTFMPDCRRLVSVSGDSCIFVWTLPVGMTRAMKKRCATQAECQSPQKSRALSRSSKNPLRGLRLSRSVLPIMDLTDEIPKGTAKEHGLNAEFELEGVALTFETKVHDDGIEEVITKDSSTVQKEDDETPTFKFSVSRLPPWAQAKVAQEGRSGSGGKHGQEKEKSPFQSSFESRWAERLGTGGYKLFSEFMEELTPPATIRPSEFGTRRRFTLEGGATTTVVSQNTPKSVISPQSDLSSKSSPTDPPRKETVWKTVHTVFFDELDFPQDESPRNHGLLLTMTAAHDEERDSENPLVLKRSAAPSISSESSHASVPSKADRQKQSRVRDDEEDGVVVYLSDNELETVITDTLRPQLDHCIEGNEDENNVYLGNPPVVTPMDTSVCNADTEGLEVFAVLRNQDTGSSDVSQSSSVCAHESAKHIDVEGEVRVSSPKKSAASDAEDEMANDLVPSSPCADHFVSLGELSVNMLLKTAPTSTARRSFSSKFFANSSSALPEISLMPNISSGVRKTSDGDTSLLQDDDLDSNPGRLLAAERERLKLRERQDKMAVEVQRMRERLVNLGIAVAEIANDGEPFECRKGAGDERQSEQTSPTSETPDCMPSASPSLVQDSNNERVSSTQSATTIPLSSSSSHNVNSTPSVFSFAQFCKLPNFPRKLHCGKEGHEEKALKAEKKAPEGILREGETVASSIGETESRPADTCKNGKELGPNKSLKISTSSNSGLRTDTQPVLPNNLSGFHPSAGLQNSPLQSTSMSFLSVDDDLSSGESFAATFHGCSLKEEIVEMTVTCTGAGWDFSPMELTDHEEGADAAHSGSEISEQEVEQNGPSCPPSEATIDSPLSEPAMPIFLPRCKQVSNPLQDYTNALQELVEAADRASILFEQVRNTRSGQTTSTISSYEVDSTSQMLLPKAFEKVQKLVQEAGPMDFLNRSASVELRGRSDMPMSSVTSSDQCFLFQRSSGNGGISFSRPQTGISVASESLSSVDIDSFIDRYSTRFSQTLASQVLALVRSGLDEKKTS
ncbi:hypothetical protein Mapa_009353 [Marchantia paleacea]|nr:hypothetical protein Mapa_009353 [Marchantia paleacea]